MRYIDGVLTLLNTANKESCRTIAIKSAILLKEFGVTRFFEYWGDALPDGKVTFFNLSVKAEGSEKVIFSLIEWLSNAVRDAGNEVYERPSHEGAGRHAI